MYGVVTRNEGEVSWEEFDRAFFEMKDVTGRATEPVPGAVNMISCFGDNAAAEGNPDVVPVSDAGERATRELTYFDWDYVCPTHDEYRAGILEMIEDAAAATEDVRLDDIGFPREEYCHCERCTPTRTRATSKSAAGSTPTRSRRTSTSSSCRSTT